MKYTFKKFFLISIILITIIQSCKKNWLDAKPDQSLAIPHTLRDYKALMSASTTVGAAFNDAYATITELSAGDFYVVADPNISYYNNLSPSQIAVLYSRWINPSIYTGSPNNEKNFYSWKPDVWSNNNNYAIWEAPYQKILYANIVLEGIEKITPLNSAEQLDWKQVKGSALFYRAAWHYEIAKQFCKAYNKNTASTDLGIPLRLTSNFNEKSIRASVEQTYSQIISDLKESAELLPIEIPMNDVYKCQPTKTAAYALLARIFLSMSSYEDALNYATKALNLYKKLLDFNDPTSVTIYPDNTAGTSFQRFNDEVIFQMRGFSYAFTTIAFLNVDSNLYKSYDANDLRKNAFYRMPTTGSVNNRNRVLYRGGYQGDGDYFWTGLATDEMYLIQAECYARHGNKDSALIDLNTLLITRWKNNGSWIPITATDANDALDKVLSERKKELVFRGLRWTDLRRLNMDPQRAVTLNKFIEGQSLSLPPNSPLYVFLIPPNVIQLTGMQQNPR
jgi:tetratricopeptide (TPR) repeat protein